ncbi:phosphoribosyltransferase [Devosia rhizoryzae]|uniref:Phosphoribosyltransferase n=1 Tax=Devosia rhizoryzae TaxID=2774137 RepID=A0ABX7C280_9HYPH|nr:phosphoribosyltransferase [Devosia rhizoryzae]QQR38345.1 phosphoribosyltransferase [Devosia rhizoryzae]
MSLLPHQFWQTVDPAGSHASRAEGWVDSYPVSLPDGRQVLLPIRVLPGDGTAAVASLIINQASFAVEDAISAALAEMLQSFSPDVIIGVPTLGLTLANNVARRLGHPRLVALGTSRKFWYRDELSAPMSSITSPTHQKTLFLDPRSLPLLENRRIVVVDDVISSGTSMAAVLHLLSRAGLAPLGIGTAMLQGTRWHETLVNWRSRIVAPLVSPRFQRTASGHWRQADGLDG